MPKVLTINVSDEIKVTEVFKAELETWTFAMVPSPIKVDMVMDYARTSQTIDWMHTMSNAPGMTDYSITNGQLV